jgi:hypothetical protein
MGQLNSKILHHRRDVTLKHISRRKFAPNSRNRNEWVYSRLVVHRGRVPSLNQRLCELPPQVVTCIRISGGILLVRSE